MGLWRGDGGGVELGYIVFSNTEFSMSQTYLANEETEQASSLAPATNIIGQIPYKPSKIVEAHLNF